MKTHFSTLIILSLASSCQYLPIGIEQPAEQHYLAKTEQEILLKAESNGVNLTDVFLATHLEYATTSHPVGQNLRVFNSVGIELDLNLCHADVPNSILKRIEREELKGAEMDRNFFESDLPYLKAASEKNTLDRIHIRDFEYLLVYYWDDFDYRFHGKFNFVKKEFAKMQTLIPEKNLSEKVILIGVNLDNQKAFEVSEKAFFEARTRQSKN